MVNFTMLVRNRPRLTKQALDGLIDTDCRVLIVDDGSDEETQEILKPWSVFRNLLSLGTGSARNIAIRQSEYVYGRGQYLYLSDNDVCFRPGWLGVLIDLYEDAWKDGCRVLGAVGHPYHQKGALMGICSFTVMYGAYEVLAQPLQSMIMRWEVWDKYGPFVDTPPGRVCMGEDVAFTNKIRADGFKIGVVDPPLLVNTGITNSFGEKIPGWELVKAQCPEGVICE